MSNLAAIYNIERNVSFVFVSEYIVILHYNVWYEFSSNWDVFDT